MLLTTITRGGSFLILQDVMGWATGFFIPFLGEGKKKLSPLNQILRDRPSPVLYDQFLDKNIRTLTMGRDVTKLKGRVETHVLCFLSFCFVRGQN